MSKLRVAASMALEQLRLNVENLREGMTPSMQRLQAQFQEDVITAMAEALADNPALVQPTTAEVKVLWSAAERKPSVFASLLWAKYEEKNS